MMNLSQNMLNKNTTFGMPWVMTNDKINLRKLKPNEIGQLCTREEGSEPIDYLPENIQRKINRSNSFNIYGVERSLEKIEKNSPYHAVFYQKGLFRDKLCAVPTSAFTDRVDFTKPVDKELMEPTVVYVSKYGNGLNKALRRLNRDISKRMEYLDYFLGNSDSIK